MTSLFAGLLVLACHSSPSSRPGAPSSPEPQKVVSSTARPTSKRILAAYPKAPRVVELPADCGPYTRYYVVAEGRTAEAPVTSWDVKLQEMGNHTLAMACIRYGQGCVQPRFMELDADGWKATAPPLSGLPTAAAVDLIKAPGSPFSTPSHELRPPVEASCDYLCQYFNQQRGTVSIDGLVGDWGKSVWAKVTYAMDYGGVPYSDLYRYEKDQWKPIYAKKELGWAVDRILPWRDGLVAEVRYAAVVDSEVKSQIVYFGSREIPLTGWYRGQAEFAPMRDGLAVVVVRRDLPKEEDAVELAYFAKPENKPIKHQFSNPGRFSILKVVLGNGAYLYYRGSTSPEESEWKVDKEWSLTRHNVLPTDRMLANDDTCRQVRTNWEHSPTLTLGPREVRGNRSFVRAELENEQVSLLLSDKPVKEVWSLPEEVVTQPEPAKCPPGKIPMVTSPASASCPGSLSHPG